MSVSRDEILRILVRTEGQESAKELRGELGKLVLEGDRTRASQQSLGQALGKVKVELAAAAAGVYAATRVIRGAAQESSRFQTAIAEVGTLLSDRSGIPQLTQDVKALALEFGGSATTQAKAYYQVVSAGAEQGAEANRILAQSNKLAIAGVADLTVSADGLTSALNAYGAGAEEAERYSDAFFATVREGKTTVGELAGSIGQVAPIASQAGVEIEELTGTIATLTKGGVATAQAANQVRAILSAVIKPTSQASKVAEDLGIQFDLAAVRSKGLAGFLADVAEKTGGSEEAMAKLFGRVEGLQAVLALTGNQAADFRDVLESVANAAGETERAFAQMQDTPAQRMARYQAATEQLRFALGDLITALSPVLELLGELVQALTRLPEPLKAVAAGLIAVLAVAGPLALAVRALGPALAIVTGGATAAGAAATGAAAGVAAGVGLLRAAAARLIPVLGGLYLIKDIVDLIDDYGEANRRAAQASEDRERADANIAAQIEGIKRAYGGLADLQIRSNEQLDKLRDYNLSAYLSQLDQAGQYWRAVEIEAKRAGATFTAAWAREKADRYAEALSSARDRTSELAEAATLVVNPIKDLGDAFKSLKIESQASLNAAENAARNALTTIASAAQAGKATAADVRRAFDAWAKAARDAVVESDIAGRAQVEAAIAARAGVLGIEDAYKRTSVASRQSAFEQVGTLQALADTARAVANKIGLELGAAIQSGASPEAVEELRREFTGAQARVDSLNDSLSEARARLEALSPAAAKASAGIGELSSQGSNSLGNVGDQAQSAGDKVQQLGAEGEKAGEKIEQAGQAGAASMRGFVTSTDPALNNVLRMQQNVGALQQSLRDMGAEGVKAADQLAKAYGVQLAQALSAPLGTLEFVTRNALGVYERAMEFGLATSAGVSNANRALGESAAEASAKLLDMGYTLEQIAEGGAQVKAAIAAINLSSLDRIKSGFEGLYGAAQNVTSEMRAARDELEALNREAEKRALQRRGDEKALADLALAEEIARIDELERRGGAGAREAAALARKLAREEHQAKLRELREREAEEKRAITDVEDTRRRSRGGGGGGGAGLDGGSGQPQRVDLRVGGHIVGLDSTGRVDPAVAHQIGMEIIRQIQRGAAVSR